MAYAKTMLALLLALTASAAHASDPSVEDAGLHIYRDGLLPSGAALRGVLPDGTELSGGDAACARCHRRSGQGGVEGGKSIRPLAGKHSDTLARSLRAGVDATGRSLAMPRFDIGDEEVAQLAAYLDGLSQTRAPGVTASEIHFATVVAPGVDPLRTKSMLNVLETYFADKNAGMRRQGKRKAGGEPSSPPRRNWVLHVWKLEGLPESWSAQLEAHYRAQPVFAVLSGIGAGSWRPVHDFCERTELPCLFPNVDYPVVSETDYASIYFSRGMELEAEVLARHLADARGAGELGTIVQVYRDDAVGRVPAQVLRSALERLGITDLTDRPVGGPSPVPPEFWNSLLDGERTGILVLWLNEGDLLDLHALGEPPSGLARFYLSASLVASPCRILMFEPWLAKVRLIYPFELASQRASRVDVWLRARNLSPLDERIQANTYFAVTVAADALAHMPENLSRDHFIERVEQATEHSLSSALYPRLSLGPGQRYASRGGYVVRLSGIGENMLVPVSDWIVP